MSTGDEPANLSAIAPPKMVLSMSLQLSCGTAAETDFKPTVAIGPDFVCQLNLSRQRIVANVPPDWTHSRASW
jgi:hypothetical protein